MDPRRKKQILIGGGGVALAIGLAAAAITIGGGTKSEQKPTPQVTEQAPPEKNGGKDAKTESPDIGVKKEEQAKVEPAKEIASSDAPTNVSVGNQIEPLPQEQSAERNIPLLPPEEESIIRKRVVLDWQLPQDAPMDAEPVELVIHIDEKGQTTGVEARDRKQSRTSAQTGKPFIPGAPGTAETGPIQTTPAMAPMPPAQLPNPIQTQPAETAPIQTTPAMAPMPPAQLPNPIQTQPAETSPIQTTPAMAPMPPAQLQNPIQTQPAETSPIQTTPAMASMPPAQLPNPIQTQPAETSPIQTTPAMAPMPPLLHANPGLPQPANPPKNQTQNVGESTPPTAPGNETLPKLDAEAENAKRTFDAIVRESARRAVISASPLPLAPNRIGTAFSFKMIIHPMESQTFQARRGMNANDAAKDRGTPRAIEDGRAVKELTPGKIDGKGSRDEMRRPENETERPARKKVDWKGGAEPGKSVGPLPKSMDDVIRGADAPGYRKPLD